MIRINIDISNLCDILVQSPIVRSFQTSTVSRDIDSAAKFIGAGAATVGVAGSGMYLQKYILLSIVKEHNFLHNR